MSNRGFKKMLYAAHADQFLCPICDRITKVKDDDIEIVDITFRIEEYFFTCPHCGARSNIEEGFKNFSIYNQ